MAIYPDFEWKPSLMLDWDFVIKNKSDEVFGESDKCNLKWILVKAIDKIWIVIFMFRRNIWRILKKWARKLKSNFHMALQICNAALPSCIKFCGTWLTTVGFLADQFAETFQEQYVNGVKTNWHIFDLPPAFPATNNIVEQLNNVLKEDVIELECHCRSLFQILLPLLKPFQNNIKFKTTLFQLL